ncbi:MAG: beta/gamma crystallin family protein [Pseudomonadota bacterium]|nr:beta/gamma crystallin family protein [Pseudomonadota bacterium]
MKRLIAAAAVLASLAPAAFAGQLTLFADSEFRGNQVTLSNSVANLNDLGFNDRTSSVVVRSGTWQLCEHANFGGYCAELRPGEYRFLSGFNDKVSSVREVGVGGRRGDARDDRRGEYDRRDERDVRRNDERAGGEYRGDRGRQGENAVQMFAGPRFEGQPIGLFGNLRTLNEVGFNDRAGSLIIREGTWEMCEHADFRGQCVVYGPGRYPSLGEMNNRISSMRRVR